MDYLYDFAPAFLWIGSIVWIGCIVHAIATRRYFPWLMIIFFLHAIGALIYLAVEVIPGLAGARTTRKLATGLASAADPNRGYRQARRAVELVGSVDAKRALAEEHVARGRYGEAIALYESMLTGQFAEDPAILGGLARARFLAGDFAGAQTALETLRRVDPANFSYDEQLLYARCLEAQGKDAEALAVYRKVAPVYPGQEARCRYARLLQKTGNTAEARAQFADIVKSLDGAPRHYRRDQKEWGDIARAALR